MFGEKCVLEIQDKERKLFWQQLVFISDWNRAAEQKVGKKENKCLSLTSSAALTL